MRRQSSAAQMLLLGACRLGLSLSAAAAVLLLVHRSSLSRAERHLLLRLRCAASQFPHAWLRCDEGVWFSVFYMCRLSLTCVPNLKIVEKIQG